MEHPEIDGVLNCTAPEPVKNKVLMKMIRNTYGIPIGLATPTWLLEAGAFLIGTEPELILKSRWVIPARLVAAGFKFQFPVADHAIHDLISIRI